MRSYKRHGVAHESHKWTLRSFIANTICSVALVFCMSGRKVHTRIASLFWCDHTHSATKNSAYRMHGLELHVLRTSQQEGSKWASRELRHYYTIDISIPSCGRNQVSQELSRDKQFLSQQLPTPPRASPRPRQFFRAHWLSKINPRPKP